MQIDPDLFYRVMQSAERNNVIDKGSIIIGEIIEKVLNDSDIDLSDLFNALDTLSKDTLLKVDKLVGISGPLMRFAKNDYLMRGVSRILGSITLKRFVVEKASAILIRMLNGEKKTGLISRLKTAVAAKTFL